MTERRPLLWPAAVLLAIAAIVALAVQLSSPDDQQVANIISVFSMVIGLLLAWLWLVVFGRLGARRRLITLAAVIVPIALYASCFELTGFTGDLLPIFEWRWRTVVTVEAAPDDASRTELRVLEGLEDSLQFRGSTRDGHVSRRVFARDWSSNPPVEVWRRPVGDGWAGFAISGPRAITIEQHGEDETVVCYEAATGRKLWEHAYPGRYDNKVAGIGPRSTPTVHGDHAFTLGSTGQLCCLDIESGRPTWSKNVLQEHGAPVPEWGLACSPLVVEDLVIVNVGGANASVAAYRVDDGKLAWAHGDGGAHYASPVFATLHGTPQILQFNAREVAAHSLEDGAVLWAHAWRGKHPHVCDPVPIGDDAVFISSGYGTGAQLVRVARDESGAFSTKRAWRSLSMKAKFANVVVRDGFVYGLDDGRLACVDLKKGRRKWKGGSYGHGQLLLVDDVLLISGEFGELFLVEATPEEPRELGRIEVLSGKTWNPLALAGRYVFHRNDREAVCYRLPASLK